MRKSFFAALGAAVVLCPVLAQAESPSYSNLDAGYVVTDVDGLNKDLDGFLIRGSYEVIDNGFVYARYVDQSVSVLGTDVDVTQKAIGAGYALPLNEVVDLYGKVGYVEADADAGGASADDNGYELSAGLRGFALDQLELEGAVNYTDLSDSGSDTSFGVGAHWYFAPQFAVGLEGEFGDNADSYAISARWNFGR